MEENKPKKPPPPVSVKPKVSSIKVVEDGNKLVEAILAHDKHLDATLEGLELRSSEAQDKVEALEAQCAELRRQSREIDERTKALGQKTSSEDSRTREIQKYLAIYERLKTDEKSFKASCNDELERLQGELAGLDDTSDANKTELQSQLDSYLERIEAGRVELAGINRKVATLKRQIEQVPNRMELREYRLRFSELYSQVSATHRSTKQFYSLYNSLEDTKRYLEKEVSLLNSIVDSYQMISESSASREDFSRQLGTTHDGMKETCSKLEKKLQTEKIGVEKFYLEFQKLLDLKVAYEKYLKELEAECKRNDALLAECKALEKDRGEKASLDERT